jgi:hypothetical protein
MARGWESKSVEAQQEDAAERSTSSKPRLTQEQAGQLQERGSLSLSLRRVMQQLAESTNPRHRAMLETARAELERKIAALPK